RVDAAARFLLIFALSSLLLARWLPPLSSNDLLGGICSPSLLIYATLMFYPSRGVTPLWVAMGPVNRSALRIPHIFAEKCYFVASLNGVYSRCEVNIVGD